jgi:molybdopterin biosynthesis enzyme MoaB
MSTLAGSRPLSLRLAVLGPEGAAACARSVAALRAAWGRGRGLSIERLAIGDDRRALATAIRRWCDRERVDVVLTVGRSGHRREDFAPEVTARLLDRALPGVEERMYLASPRRPDDLLFRGRAGIRRTTLVVNLPARPARVGVIARFLAPALDHALEKIGGSDRECGSRSAAS